MVGLIFEIVCLLLNAEMSLDFMNYHDKRMTIAESEGAD